MAFIVVVALGCRGGPATPFRVRPKPKTPFQPACTYLTEADATAVAHKPMKARSGNSADRCRYDALDGTATIDFAIDAPAMVDFFTGKPNVEPLGGGAVWNGQQHQFAIAKDDREIFGTLTGLGRDAAEDIVRRVSPRL